MSARFRSVVPEHTSLELGESASEALARCGSSLSCLVQASERTGAAYVILAANLTTRDANIISASLLDLSLARAVVQEGGQDIDARLEREAIIAASPDYEVRTATEAQAAVDRIVLTDLWPIIEKRGLVRQLAAVLLTSAVPGARVSLDGRLLGTTPASEQSVRIQRVRPGRRTITFETDDYLPWSTTVDVSAGTSANVRFERPPTSTLQTALPWAGAGLAVVGTAVLIAAIAIPEHSTCLYLGREASCSRSDFKAWGPILAAPLGYSMMATGVSWMVVPGLLPRNREIWEVLVGGTALGVAAYLVSALVNPADSPPRIAVE
ncbi:MAG: PEGA domain-containing protein [Deltaproteobacteria bacterium]|nr:PEGA domain-containing protein [Deltaproteobacteria bacterium]